MRKVFNSHRIVLVHRHGIALEHQYDHHDVKWKRAINAMNPYFKTTWPRCLTTTFYWPFQEQFCDYMFQQAIKNEWKAITENKSKFILVSQKA